MVALDCKMNNKELYKIFFITIFLCAAISTEAQNIFTVNATVDKNLILIGEPVRLTVETNVPGNEEIRFFTIDSIPHFEFLQKGKIDTINTDNGTRLIQVITITSFDSGHWVIPSFALAESLKTDAIPVDVIFSPFNPEQPYHDIKDILEVKQAINKQKWWWYAAGAGIILVLLIIYFLSRKKPKHIETPIAIINPYEEAMRQITAIEKNKPEAKQFYSSLTDIFRVYVYRKKGILSLQKTVDDLVLQLRSLKMNKENFDQLSQALRISDFVKFAKYIPNAEDDTMILNAVKKSIQEIEQIS